MNEFICLHFLLKGTVQQKSKFSGLISVAPLDTFRRGRGRKNNEYLGNRLGFEGSFQSCVKYNFQNGRSFDLLKTKYQNIDLCLFKWSLTKTVFRRRAVVD